MHNLTKKFVSVALTTTTSVWLSGAMLLVPAAHAQSVTDLQAQINALLAQISALQGQLAATSGSGAGSSSYNFTRDLTVGSRGDDVTALQQMLAMKGFFSVAPTGYFGPVTRDALAKYQASVNISPAAGYFGPKTRSYVNSTMVGTGGTGGTGTPTGGGLSVSMASDNPMAANVPVGSTTLVPFLSVNFAAGASDVTVTGLNVTRSGLSSDSDITNVFLMDGGSVVATNLGISNGVVNFTNANGLFVVKAGQVKKIVVASAIATAGRTMAFSIASASAVTASGAVSGNFPIVGNTMQGTTVSNIGGIQITNSSAGTTQPGLSVNAGQTQFNIGQFTLLAQNQAMQVKSLKFTMTGSANTTDVSNLKLYNGGTVLGTVANLSGNTAVFDLSASPIQLSSGQSAVLYLYADIIGGVNRNFQFSVQRNYDVVAQDMMYNASVLSTLNTGSYPMNLSYVSIQQGSLTVSKSASSPSTYILPGGTNQVLAKFDVKASGEAVRVTALSVVLATSTGSIALSQITNLRAVDDAGQQIGATQATLSSLTTAYSNLNYVIPANTTRVVTVFVDLASAASGNLRASLSSITGEGFTSYGAVSLTGPYSGNYLSSNATLLSANLNNALGGVNVVAGQSGVKIASYNLTAGAGSAVNVSNLTLQTTGAVSARFQNLVLKQGTTVIGQTQPTLANSTAYNFTAPSPIQIPAGGQVAFDVYADVITGAATSSATSTVQLTGISATAVATNQAITGVPAAAVNGQTNSIVSAGTLTYTGGTMPNAAHVGMGTNGVKLASYKFTGSANEAIQINDVSLRATTTNSGLFTGLVLKNAATGATVGNGLSFDSNNTLTWVGVNTQVPQNGVLTLDVYGDANTWSALQAAGFHTSSAHGSSTVTLNSVTYQGVASSETQTATSASSSNKFEVLRNTVTPSSYNPGGLPTTVQNAAAVGGFKFTAGGTTDPVTLNSLIIGHSFSNLTATTTVPVRVYLGSTLLGSGTLGAANNSTTSLTLSPTVDVTGPSGAQNLTFQVDLSTAGMVKGTGSASYQLFLSSWAWTDGTRVFTGATGVDPAIVPPINGPVVTISG